MHTNWHPVGCFFWPRENGQEFSLMSGVRSFWNLFRDRRTPLDSIRDKIVTLIYFVIVQCQSVGTTWYSASCAKKGYTWAARDLRLPRRASSSALSADCQTLDVFVIFKVLFRIPQQLMIVQNRNIFTYHRLYERLVIWVVSSFFFTNCLMLLF